MHKNHANLESQCTFTFGISFVCRIPMFSVLGPKLLSDYATYFTTVSRGIKAARSKSKVTQPSQASVAQHLSLILAYVSQVKSYIFTSLIGPCPTDTPAPLILQGRSTLWFNRVNRI